MALASEMKLWLKGLFGNHNTSSVDVNDAVERMYERTLTTTRLATLTTTANLAITHLMAADNNITVLSAYWIPDAAITLNATNYATFSVLSGNGAAVAATTVASANTSATNIAVGTRFALTLTAANVNVDAGETLAICVVKAGAGGATTGIGSFQINYVER